VGGMNAGSLVLIERHPSPMKLDVMGVDEWPLHQSGSARFERSYQETETCYVVSGEAVVTPHGGGDPVCLQEGDLVSLLPGLTCTWELRGEFSMHHRAG